MRKNPADAFSGCQAADQGRGAAEGRKIHIERTLWRRSPALHAFRRWVGPIRPEQGRPRLLDPCARPTLFSRMFYVNEFAERLKLHDSEVFEKLFA
jgi:hypothetical protein